MNLATINYLNIALDEDLRENLVHDFPTGIEN